MSSVLSCVAGLLIALTAATQLRPLGSRVGFAELGLAALVAGVGIMAMIRPYQTRLTRTERVLGAALLLMGVFLGIGTLWGVLSQRGDQPAWSTGIAYVLSAATLISLWAADRRGWLKAATVIASTGYSTVLICTASLAMAWLTAGLCDPWYEGDVLRFTACSDNPNQVGLLFAAIPFLLLDAYCRARASGWRIFIACGLTVSLGFGAATGSDAMVVAWLVGAIAAAICWLARTGRWTLPLAAFGTLVVIVLAAGAVVLNPSTLENLADRLITAADTNDQGSFRLALWERGIESTLDSKLLGWGPGAFSLPDEEGIRQEAHNTPIDWASQAGLGGIFALLWAWLTILLGLHRYRQAWLLAASSALCTFALFHFVLRQPAFWVMVALPMLTLTRWPVGREDRRRLGGQQRQRPIGNERGA